MKKIIAVTGFILISLIVISSYASAENAKPVIGSTVTEEVPIASAPPENGYIVSVFAGKVAIYRESDNQVIFTTDNLVSDLPPQDQEFLKRGIYAPTIREADKLIQKYCS